MTASQALIYLLNLKPPMQSQALQLRPLIAGPSGMCMKPCRLKVLRRARQPRDSTACAPESLANGKRLPVSVRALVLVAVPRALRQSYGSCCEP